MSRPRTTGATPYAEALTRFLLRHRLSSSLPRKFKIGFEGCSRDHIKLTINDIGWLARVQGGKRGFRVYVGGGTATMTTAAAVLFEFLPVEDTLNVAEAVIRVFHERGDYQHKQRNRMKFLIKAMGWESCKLAVTQSRGLGQALQQHLRETPALIDLARELDIKISGCPNGCGQNHIATIGFQGSLRKVDGKAVPQYVIQVGGGIDADRTTFGRLAAKVPARRAATALERLVRLYAREKQNGESPVSFFRRLEVPRVKALLADLEAMTSDTTTETDYIDLAETTPFRPETMEGECAT